MNPRTTLLSHCKAAAALLLLTSATGVAQIREDAQWFATAQTGMADTFQLTLGGTFGGGPAWQSRSVTGLRSAFRAGDVLSVYGWDTVDARTHVSNWQAGLGYQTTVLKKRGRVLTLGSGLQRWLFPSVRCGTNDWLVPGNLTGQAPLHGKLSAIVTADSWTLLKSPLPLGSLLHTQAWLQYTVYKRDRFQIGFKNGPAHTYSWNFYGTQGNRVFRYQTMLSIVWPNTSIEGGYRKQWGLQNGIPSNHYWQFAISRTISRPLHPR